MENATKALLIAAAVLVAILIISLGLVIFNMGSEVIGSVDISSTEVEAHNNQFKQYEGEKVRGSTVNAMLGTVLTNNLTATDDSRKVTVSGAATLASSASSITKRVDTGKLFKVVCTYSKTGLINAITVTAVN